MPTKRENLVALLRGERPAWTPCTINVAQWYTHHNNHGTLPAELRQTTDQLDAMKLLGCDVFSRNLDGGIRLTTTDIKREDITEKGALGPRLITRFQTPHGSLQRISEQQTAMTSGYQVEDLVKDWSRDAKAYRWLLEHSTYEWNDKAFDEVNTRIGDDGVLMVAVSRTPLKQLHVDFGLDHACLFMLDEPEAAKECCDLHWRATWPVLQKLAADPRVHAACLMDNVDAPFYPPPLAKRYWTPYVREAADLFNQHGKRLFVHACGHLHQLREEFIAAGVHGLEGMSHGPLGDFEPAHARSMPRHFIYNGGFTAHEQVTKSDAEVRAFYKHFFRELNGHDRFIFAAACQTAITTTWDRIKLTVECCRTHGGNPN